jgi:hypothetical protein
VVTRPKWRFRVCHRRLLPTLLTILRLGASLLGFDGRNWHKVYADFWVLLNIMTCSLSSKESYERGHRNGDIGICSRQSDGRFRWRAGQAVQVESSEWIQSPAWTSPTSVDMASLPPTNPHLQSPERIGQHAPNCDSQLLRYAAFQFLATFILL